MSSKHETGRRAHNRPAILRFAHERIDALLRSDLGLRMSRPLRNRLGDLDAAVLRGLRHAKDDIASQRSEKEIEILRLKVLAHLPETDEEARLAIRAVAAIFDHPGK